MLLGGGFIIVLDMLVQIKRTPGPGPLTHFLGREREGEGGKGGPGMFHITIGGWDYSKTILTFLIGFVTFPFLPTVRLQAPGDNLESKA